MRSSLLRMLFIGLLLQATAGALGWLDQGSMTDAMRMAARYSGRISFLAYLTAMWAFARWATGAGSRAMAADAAIAFAWIHLLHFGYLAANIRMSDITPEWFKAVGGALAYVMILTHAMWVRRWPAGHPYHAVHFSYVGLVMVGTFVSRWRGEFPGSEPSPLHGVGVVATVLALAGFFWARKSAKAG